LKVERERAFSSFILIRKKNDYRNSSIYLRNLFSIS